MARKAFDPQKAARALHHADLVSAKAAAEEYKVTTGTIYGWRKRLAKGTTAADAEFRKAYTALRDPESAEGEPEATPSEVLRLMCGELLTTAPVVFGSIRDGARKGQFLAATKSLEGMLGKLNALMVLAEKDEDGDAE